MRITEAEFKRTGELEEGIAVGVLKEQQGHTNEELANIIKVKKLVMAYLQGRGERWRLALTPLCHELYALEGFVESRKRDKS